MKKALATLGLTATAAALLAVTAGPASAELHTAPAEFHTAPGIPANIQTDPAPAEIPAVPAATAARDLLEGAGLVVPAAGDYITPGAFCTNYGEGETGVSKKGIEYTCTTDDKGYLRWRRS
ncbi:hypothetical protein [Nocardia concava]|uniref:hypothetical protein n=1 Tax=Nocardia concava TaxID=257281 RepID=UPI0002E45DF2|nr:hypothetical protein [Nocardia concava]